LDYSRARGTRFSFLQLVGAGCLVIVVLIHISEAPNLFPRLHLGRENSVGHYLDFWSAVLGLTLFPLGYLLADAWAKHHGHHLAAIMAEGVDFVPVGGGWVHGRANFEKYHTRLLSGFFRDPTNMPLEPRGHYLLAKNDESSLERILQPGELDLCRYFIRMFFGAQLCQ